MLVRAPLEWHVCRVHEWLAIASRPEVVRRALIYAVVVGALLAAINHGDAIVRADLDGVRLMKIALTVVVPYLVSTFSSVAAIRAVGDGVRLRHERAKEGLS
jgi:hypothetical protein